MPESPAAAATNRPPLPSANVTKSRNDPVTHRPILPQTRSVLDKVIDALVGDGPDRRYALICRSCAGHNGMALAEEFEYLAFRCCYCQYLNAARRQRQFSQAGVPRLDSFNSPTGPVTPLAGTRGLSASAASLPALKRFAHFPTHASSEDVFVATAGGAGGASEGSPKFRRHRKLDQLPEKETPPNGDESSAVVRERSMSQLS